MPFYAVRYGKSPGIYKTWDECKEQVIGVKGSVYKKFNDKKSAEEFIKDQSKTYKNMITNKITDLNQQNKQQNKQLKHKTFESNMMFTLIYIFIPAFLGPTLFLINWKMAVSIFITWVPFGFYYVVSRWVRYYRNST